MGNARIQRAAGKTDPAPPTGHTSTVDAADALVATGYGHLGGPETANAHRVAGGHVVLEKQAPPFGLEPKTCRLTAGCSAN